MQVPTVGEQLAAAIARGSIGTNCFVATTHGGPSSELLLFCSLDAIHSQKSGRSHGGKKKRPSASFTLGKCHDVPVQDGGTSSVTMEVTTQTNIGAIDRAALAEQCHRNRQVEPCLSWDVVTAKPNGEEYLAITLDLARIALNMRPTKRDGASDAELPDWERTATLGCGLRLSIAVRGCLLLSRGAHLASDGHAAPASLAEVRESIFHASANEAGGVLDVRIAVPAFFLDKAKGLREEPGMHTLEWMLPSGVVLNVSLRRNTLNAPATALGPPQQWSPVVTSSGRHRGAAQVATQYNTESPPTLWVRVSNWSAASVDCATAAWEPVAIAADTLADLMLSLTAVVDTPVLPESAADDDSTPHCQVYAHVYELLRPRPQYGLASLRMPEIAEHCERQGSFIPHASHPQSVRDAVRHYIVSARRGSPEKPRPCEDVEGVRRTQSTARSIPSHDF